MEKIKNTAYAVAVLFISTALLTSCSNNGDSNNDIGKNAKVSTFLRSFYAKDFKFGKSKQFKINNQSNSTTENTGNLARAVTFEDVILMEVFVNNEERARGYVINDKDTNEFLYFIDVDRVAYKLTNINIEADEIKVIDDINQLDRYSSTNQFDFIKIAQDLSNQPVPPPVVQRWRYSFVYPKQKYRSGKLFACRANDCKCA